MQNARAKNQFDKHASIPSVAVPMLAEELEEAVDSISDFFAGGDSRLPSADFVSRTRGLVDQVANRQQHFRISSSSGKHLGPVVEELIYDPAKRSIELKFPVVQDGDE